MRTFYLLPIYVMCTLSMQEGWSAEITTLNEKEEILNLVNELIANVPLSVEDIARIISVTNFKKINTDIVSYDTFVSVEGGQYFKEIEFRKSNLPASLWVSHTSILFDESVNLTKDDIIANYGRKNELVMPPPRSLGSVPIYYKYKKSWGSYSFGISNKSGSVISVILREENSE